MDCSLRVHTGRFKQEPNPRTLLESHAQGECHRLPAGIPAVDIVTLGTTLARAGLNCAPHTVINNLLGFID